MNRPRPVYRTRRPMSPGCAIMVACLIVAAVISPWALLVLVLAALLLAALGFGKPRPRHPRHPRHGGEVPR